MSFVNPIMGTTTNTVLNRVVATIAAVVEADPQPSEKASCWRALTKAARKKANGAAYVTELSCSPACEFQGSHKSLAG